jgi:hypothetical protein
LTVAVEDLELRIPEDERIMRPDGLEPIKVVPEVREVREEVPLDDALASGDVEVREEVPLALDDALDGGDVGVLIEHLRAGRRLFEEVVANRGLIPCSSAAPGLGKDAGGARVVPWPGRGNLGFSLLRYLAWCS